MTKGKAVETVAGIVGVEGEKSFKVELQNFLLQETNLMLIRVFPKLAVEIETGAAVASSLGITSGVTDRVDEEFIALGKGGVEDKFAKETNCSD
jgi:hypothetical protein